MTDNDWAVHLAGELLQIGVSRDGVVDLLSHYPLETIARQVEFMPMRKAKRPAAFIIEAIRKDFSAPNKFYHASNKTNLATPDNALDEDPEYPAGRANANPQGHGVEAPTSPAPANDRLES